MLATSTPNVAATLSEENQWSQPVVNGEYPKVRHGHVMIAVKNNIYLHGGMAGTEIFGDLWKLAIGMLEPWNLSLNGDMLAIQ